MPKAENVLKCHLASSYTSSKNAKVKPKNENQTDVVCKEGGGGRRLIVIIQKYINPKIKMIVNPLIHLNFCDCLIICILPFQNQSKGPLKISILFY